MNDREELLLWALREAHSGLESLRKAIIRSPGMAPWGKRLQEAWEISSDSLEKAEEVLQHFETGEE